MEEYTFRDCRLAEKRFQDRREYELNNLRLMLTAVINTTAQKKSDIKKPEDVMRLPMDDINNYHKGKVAEARASKERQQEIWQMFRKVRPLDQDGKLKG